MIIRNAIIALCSIFFFMIGFDKFLNYLEPPCSLESSIPALLWKILGALQIVSGVLIWQSNYRKHIAGFWSVFMIIFTLVHLSQGQSDIGGALFMAALLGILIWNPDFLGKRE